MKIADASKLYELGGYPIDKLAAIQLAYGKCWVDGLAPDWLLNKRRLPSNDDLEGVLEDGTDKWPGLYEYCKRELEIRNAYAKTKSAIRSRAA